MSNSTSINELPSNPVVGENNISMSVNTSEQINNNPNNNPNNTSSSELDSATIAQIVNGIQKIGNSGVTSLPGRDIPRNTDNLIHDPAVQPNFIPPPANNYYINDDYDEMATQKYNNEEQTNNLDSFYNEFHLPLLLSILYFIFQLPFVKRMLFKYIPVLFNNDCNFNIYGLLVNSGLFSFMYYMLSKSMNYFNTF